MIRIVKNSSQVGDADADRPGTRVRRGWEATRPFTPAAALPGPVHSFDNSARSSPPRACSQGPRPSLGRPSLQARPGAARQPRTPPVEPRRALCSPEPQPGLQPQRAPTPPALPASGSPASAPLRRLTCRVRETAAARVRPGPRPRPWVSSARRRVPGVQAGRCGPRPTHLRRAATEGPALSRLKPLGPPHTPQCPRCLLVRRRPPLALLLVRLKGLWVRAACGLKGAARSCGPLNCASGEQPMATNDFRTKSARCVEIYAFPAFIMLPLPNYGCLNYCQHLCLIFLF